MRTAEDPQSPSGILYPQWSVTAYDNVTMLGSVGENIAGTYSNLPAQTFSLNYSNITSITIEGNAEGAAGISSAELDTFTYDVPEPSTWAMLVGGLGLLGLWRLRKVRAS